MKTILKRTRTETGIRNVYLTAFILLLVAYLINLFVNRQLLRQAAKVEHTNEIIKKLDDVLNCVADGETGVRGYIITRKMEFLFPYFGTAQRSDSICKELIILTKDNDQQHVRMIDLRKLVERRFSILQFSLRSFDQNNREISDSMKGLQTEARDLMESIRTKANNLELEENKFLVARQAELRRITNTITAITIISLTLSFLLIVFGFITYMKVSRARQKGERSIIDYQQQLTKRIADLDEANRQLIKMRSQEKFAATGRIARTIAHEVRNPLTNINLAVDQLRNETFKRDDTSDMLFGMITRNSTRINQLISDLLNSTKFSELSYTSMSLNTLLDEAIREASDRISLSNVQVIKKYSSDPCVVSVDIAKMKIALLNIIINAIEAMENGKDCTLTLETKLRNGKCQVTISDNGRGMGKEDLNRLFEPYFTSKPKGNGLGLTNTQNIILNHKGEISAQSKEGLGTSFIITLNAE